MSAVYLVAMTLVCAFGPLFTGHTYTTIYRDYVRVPPSLSAYPADEEVEGALIRCAAARPRRSSSPGARRAARVIAEVTEQARDRRPHHPLPRPLQPVRGRAHGSYGADRLSATMSASIERNYFFFGTDNSGRDLMTRTLIAGRVSLAIGLLAGFVAVVIGVIYGAASGYLGGKVDEIMMRIVDILYSLPFIFFVILLVVFFGRNFILMFIAVGAVLWLDMARIVRGQTLSIKRQEYIQAAQALGVSSKDVLLRHVVPNTLGPVVVYMTLLVPQVIILESFLSYLGLGVQEPMTSWGVLIAEGADNIPAANWLLIFPSLFLTTTLFALNFLGDGLRDALDPKDR